MKRKKILGWTEQASPKQLKKKSPLGGWFEELDRVYVDNTLTYCVMLRDIETEEMGTITHAAIKCVSNKDIPWIEKQRIKNEIFGKDACAIEVFPKEEDLVDSAYMYHIWVLHDFKLPFSL